MPHRHTYDAILVPGGGVRAGGQLPPWVENRLQRALEVYAGEMIITLSAGTVHKPPTLDSDGFPIYESVAAARYLVSRGIPPTRILVETCSYDTIGNAYFSKVIHVDPAGYRNLLIITSEFHLVRTEQIFRWVYGLDAPAGRYTLTFEATPDAGLEPAALRERQAREAHSLAQLAPVMRHITTLSAFHDWLYTAHGAYAVATAPVRARGSAVESY